MALVNALAEDQIVRKFVVFVENISRGEFPQTGLPYKGLGQEMPVSEIDDNLFVMDQLHIQDLTKWSVLSLKLIQILL